MKRIGDMLWKIWMGIVYVYALGGVIAILTITGYFIYKYIQL